MNVTSALIGIALAVLLRVGATSTSRALPAAERVNTMNHRQLIALLLVSAPVSALALDNHANANSPLGTNVLTASFWTSEHPYIDAGRYDVWHAEQLWGGCWDEEPLPLDANGDVLALAHTYCTGGPQIATKVVASAGTRYPSGRYVVLYDGQGEEQGSPLRYSPPSVATVVESTNGRDVVDVDSSQGMFRVSIVSTDPADHVRNVRVIVPGGICDKDIFSHADFADECGESFYPYEWIYRWLVFHPRFLANWRGYSTIRFMDLLRINGSEQVGPASLRSPASTIWDPMPPQLVAHLGNLLNADVWVNVPHLATDAFVMHFAWRLIHSLDESLNIYVEYSNEIWNQAWDYPQGAEIAPLGCELYPDLQAGCDADGNPGNGIYCEGHPWPTYVPACTSARNRYHAERTVEVGTMFRKVSKSLSHDPDRVIVVLGGWANGLAHNEEILADAESYGAVDALAIAPYFGGYVANPANHALIEGWVADGGFDHALDQLFAELTDGVLYQEFVDDPALDPPSFMAQYQDGALAAAAELMYANADLANEHGVRLIAYEGGQHLANYRANATIDELVVAANRDPRMGNAYQEYLQAWMASGGELMVLFTSAGEFSGANSFGMLEYQDQPHEEAPKYEAARIFMESTACWWNQCGDQ